MRRLRPPPNSTVYPYTTLFRSHATSPEYGTDGTGDDASGGVGTRPAPPSVNPGHGLRAPCEISATGSRVSIMSRAITGGRRSEEHTSEVQSRRHLLCRLPLEKTKHSISQ